MTHKTQESYGALFTYLTNKAAQLRPLDLNPIRWAHILTDFESGLLPALNAHVFGNPVVQVRGCHFHHTQCIWRQVQREGLSQAYRTEPEVHAFITGLFAIPFVPSQQVLAAYEDFVASERSLVAIVNFPGLQHICLYYSNFWLHGIYPIEMWNVYDLGEIRTNNNIEGWHRDCRMIFGKHPMLYNFLGKLHESQK
jgi:hypothetical protein